MTAVLVLCAVLAVAAVAVIFANGRGNVPCPTIIAYRAPAPVPLPSRAPVSGERLTGPLPVLRAGWPEVRSG